jgi:hypothetical protein
MRQGACAGVAAGGAVIHAGLAAGHRLGVGAAAVKAALAALGLRQQAVQTFDQRSPSFSLREKVARSVGRGLGNHWGVLLFALIPTPLPEGEGLR